MLLWDYCGSDLESLTSADHYEPLAMAPSVCAKAIHSTLGWGAVAGGESGIGEVLNKVYSHVLGEHLCYTYVPLDALARNI